jgi:hypothetical protein
MRALIVAIGMFVFAASVGFTYYQVADPGIAMTEAGGAFVATLDEEQRKTVVLPADTPQQVDWHFIPKDHRKGLQIKHMNEQQRKAAHTLLQRALSEIGYTKATKIMELETLLHELEAGRGRNIRDPERYYFTMFGEPKPDARWGLSVEGHHLSLNFVVENGRVIASTPQMYATNPAVVKTENQSGIAVGTRILAKEETLAFDLVNSLSDAQKQTAIIDETAPREIRDPGSAQPPTDPPVGITHENLNAEQRKLLQQLVQEYADAMPEKVARQRLDRIEADGWGTVHFAWAGALEPGIGHYYRVQGPSFLIEFVNVQPDAAGNPANHIHSVWRNMEGDFGIPIGE